MPDSPSKVQVDNADVRVTRWTLDRGEATGDHRHEHDYVVVPVAPGRMEVTGADGTQSTSDLATGTSYYRARGAEHNVRNAGEGALDFVEIEVVRPSRSAGEVAPSRSGSGCRVRPLGESDYERWRELYRGYADFYRVDQPEQSARRVWSWIHDPQHEVQGLAAEDGDGRMVGLAHYRPFARPLSATVGCWLDDLFVDPASRGSGAAEALLTELARLAKDNDWSVVRWITADDNHRARSKYDRVATRTQWVTYDMPPAR